MVEVQAHGFSFEDWVRRSLFAGYNGSYSQKWDVPADANTSPPVPPPLRRMPVSIKTAKLGSPINLGDILRQRQIGTDFLLIAGFWQQRSPGEKWFVDIGVAHFTAAFWASLWGELTLPELQKIDALIKDLDLLEPRSPRRDALHSARATSRNRIAK